MQYFWCGSTSAESKEKVYLLFLKVNNKKYILYITCKIQFIIKETSSCSQYSESLKTLSKNKKVVLLNKLMSWESHVIAVVCSCSLKGEFFEQHSGELSVLALAVFHLKLHLSGRFHYVNSNKTSTVPINSSALFEKCIF